MTSHSLYSRIYQTVPLTLLSVFIASCNNSSSSGTSSGSGSSANPIVYSEHPIRSEQQSAGFIGIGDLDGNSDNGLEILLSTLVEQTPPGPPNALSRGALRIFNTSGCDSKDGSCLDGPWEENILINTTDLQGYPFINTPQIFDVNDDGQLDIVVQTGFLSTLGGAHFWLDGNDLDGPLPPTQNFFSLANTTPLTNNLFFWHETDQADIDGDGLLDIVTTSAKTQGLDNPLGSANGEEEMKVQLYTNNGGTDPSSMFDYSEIVAIDTSGNEISNMGGVFIKLYDIDNDGDEDIVLSQFFGHPTPTPEIPNPAVIWLENDLSVSGEWVYRIIDNSIGLGYHMEFADIDNDGQDELIVGAHNNDGDPRFQDDEGNLIVPPGLYWFEIPNDPLDEAKWEKHIISTDFRVTLYYSSPASQGVPGIFNVGDINNDGLLDVAVPGDGNDKLFAFIQQSDGSFREDIVATGKMFGMAMVADIDGDGKNEIVAAQHNSLDMDPADTDSLDDLTLPPGRLSIFRYPQD
ncbi:Uncharacterised protein [Zhongshania aliphaticivorans]|uniref:VCBS repeat-containing protein n=1 Tax=Zhongshania aliphaticivorans TaxID=1470434 RepID=A0A5S9N6X6_9GAMM|nr:VCBS repeat-containing protein [Zhongshania aliphaticivorans]CAA0081504.1 Uncharacterised protein [Zhongshania aliphaticivorans]CAA0084842.1 Uncharacterised protein [Zhongshania aliphaticivorans]